MQQFGASNFHVVVHWQIRWGGKWVHLTLFRPLSHQHAKNYWS